MQEVRNALILNKLRKSRLVICAKVGVTCTGLHHAINTMIAAINLEPKA